MIYVDGPKHHYYSILMGIMIDYKEQVLITRKKPDMQCSICHVFSQEWENFTKI